MSGRSDLLKAASIDGAPRAGDAERKDACPAMTPLTRPVGLVRHDAGVSRVLAAAGSVTGRDRPASAQ